MSAPWVQARRAAGVLVLALASLVCSLSLIPVEAGISAIASVRDPAKLKKKKRGLRVGLVTNAQDSVMGAPDVLDEAQSTGAKWLRETVDWRVVEPQDDAWTWDRYDKLFTEAAKRRMRILPELIGTPSWAGSSWNAIPADPSEYAEYTAKVVGRYGPHGRFWRRKHRRCRRHGQSCRAHRHIASFAPRYFEFWNEPYLDSYSAGGVDPGRYARLVRAAARAGHSSNRRARYLLAAEQAPSGARNTFIDGMYSAVPHLNAYFDAVAVHPYPGSSSPDELKDGWGFTERLDAIRRKFVDHRARHKPLWITEIGWSTCPSGEDCVTEEEQAAYLARMFELVGTTYSRYVRAAFVYHRTDLNDDPSDTQGWFGLARLDGSHKLAYYVFRLAASGG